jgi:hypothetical protein
MASEYSNYKDITYIKNILESGTEEQLLELQMGFLKAAPQINLTYWIQIGFG